MTTSTRLENLSRKFDSFHARRNISLIVNAGELVAMLGLRSRASLLCSNRRRGSTSLRRGYLYRGALRWSASRHSCRYQASVTKLHVIAAHDCVRIHRSCAARLVTEAESPAKEVMRNGPQFSPDDAIAGTLKAIRRVTPDRPPSRKA